jgi:GrpB-like predicted nucleotidyltransferase (UPF0157 family)
VSSKGAARRNARSKAERADFGAVSIEWFGQPKGDPPAIAPFDPSWATIASDWIQRLDHVLASLDARIEHVGSTAVPGLAAKPVIDLQVAVPRLADEQAYRPAIESIGLPLRARAPDHRFFRPAATAARAVHVHVCEQGSAWERQHILFRDFLRAHPDRREEYAQLKRRLAASVGGDRALYGAEKEDFISGTLEDAEQWIAREAEGRQHSDG